MIPAPTYDQINRILNETRFELDLGTATSIPSTARTVGFILFDQNFDRYSISDFVRNLDTLHVRSGTSIHFFLCGVSMYGGNEPGARKLGELDGAELYHNAKAAHSFVAAFEQKVPGWNYDLGFELLLVDVVEEVGRKDLDFSSAVYFKVDELLKLGIIERPTQLFGKLVKFSLEGKFINAAAFRHELRSVFGGNWVKGLVLAMFPKSIRKLARAEAVLGGAAAVSD